MVRARLVRALPPRLQTIACVLLIGHVRHVDPNSARLALICEVCPHRTPGIDASTASPVVTQPGDPRRVESYTRRWHGPQEPPVDWHAAEHFQGEHARGL